MVAPAELSGLRVLRVVPLRSPRGLYGGPSDSALAQARLIADLGLRVRLSSGAFPGEPAEGEPAGVDVRQYPVRALIPRIGFPTLFSLRMMTGIVRDVRWSQVVHVSFSREVIPILTVLTCLLLRRPYVAQPHGMLTARSSAAHKILDLIVKPLYRRSAQVVALAVQEKVELQKWCTVSDSRFSIVGNPAVANLDGSLGDSIHGEYAAIYLGRIEKRKRVTDFALAAQLSAQYGGQEHYLIVGPDQEPDPSLDELVAATENLHKLPPVAPSEVPKQLLKAQVFVLPSSREPWGNVLVLALGLGIPVVVTRSTALAPLIESYGAGEIVDDRDPAAIAAAVHRLVSEPQTWGTASTNAKGLYSARLSNDAVGSLLLTAYHRSVH